MVAKCDYALNGGVASNTHDIWPSKPGIFDVGPNAAGLNPPVRAKQILDGLSKTYLVGEKGMYSSRYTTGEDGGDIGTPYSIQTSGQRHQIGRWSIRVPQNDPFRPPIVAQPTSVDDFFDDVANNFGSAHASAWNMVLCDGSVHALSYNMSLATHQALASRDGGDSPDEKEY